MLIVLLISRFRPAERFLLRATACYGLLCYPKYRLHPFIGMGLLHGTPNEMFSTFMSPGPLRSIYLLLNKATDIIVFISLHKELHKLSSLRNSLQDCSSALLFILLLDAVSIQYCVIRWLCILTNRFHNLFLLSPLLYVRRHFRLTVCDEIGKAPQRQRDLTAYQRDDGAELPADAWGCASERKAAPWFSPSFRSDSGIGGTKKTDEIIDYIDSMLSTSYEAIEFCNCGCDIINAVINCKALEARSSHIEFQYHVDFHEPTNLKPVDICAVLANQIENALEACEKIEDPDKRIVRVEIRQRNGFALFQGYEYRPRKSFFDMKTSCSPQKRTPLECMDLG